MVRRPHLLYKSFVVSFRGHLRSLLGGSHFYSSRLACRVFLDGRYGGHSCWSCSGPWLSFGQFFVGPLHWRQPEGNTAGGLLWSYPNSFVRLLSLGCCGWWGFFRVRGFEVLCFGILWFRANQEDSLGFALYFGGVFPSSLFLYFLCQSSTLKVKKVGYYPTIDYDYQNW